MRSKEVIEKKLKRKESFIKTLDKEVQSHEYEYQQGFIQALFWVLNKTV